MQNRPVGHVGVVGTMVLSVAGTLWRTLVHCSDAHGTWDWPGVAQMLRTQSGSPMGGKDPLGEHRLLPLGVLICRQPELAVGLGHKPRFFSMGCGHPSGLRAAMLSASVSLPLASLTC